MSLPPKLEALPDDILIRLGDLREMLEEVEDKAPTTKATNRWPSVRDMPPPVPMPDGAAAKLTIRDDLVGNGWDDEPLLTVKQVAVILSVSVNTAYELPIDRIRVGRRSIRFRPQDVHGFIQRRSESL